MDGSIIKKDFPIFQQPGAAGVVFADSTASSQKPAVVIDTEAHVQRTTYANIHRGVYKWSVDATNQYEAAREKVRAFLHASGTEEIVWTRNATESLNLLAYTWGEQEIQEGDEIIVTEMEHHANIVPWQQLAKRKKAVLTFWPVTDDGRLELSALHALLTERTKLVSMVHMSNTLGTVNDIHEAAKVVKAHGALFIVDAAQSGAHIPIDVQEIGCDALVMSSHKMCGPSGVGVLFAKKELLKSIPPFLFGGDMILSVTKEESVWNDLPWKFEAGTPDIAGVIAFGAAIDYIEKLGREEIWKHEQALTTHGLETLGLLADVRILGPHDAKNRGAVFSMHFEGLHPHDAGSMLDEQGVYVRAGHHCTQPLHERFGLAATTRASFFIYNTKEDIDRTAEAITKALDIFKSGITL
ncbi:MAG: SufS family cysteine desulfurase [Patescibacteria group bacterium]|jgi:cysteine desulfurase/selenocysteine lyase